MSQNENMKNKIQDVTNKPPVSPKTGKINPENQLIDNKNNQNKNFSKTNFQNKKEQLTKKVATTYLNSVGVPKAVTNSKLFQKALDKGLQNSPNKFLSGRNLVKNLFGKNKNQEEGNASESLKSGKTAVSFVAFMLANPFIFLPILLLIVIAVFFILFSSSGFWFLDASKGSADDSSGSSNFVNPSVAYSYKNMTGITLEMRDGTIRNLSLEEYIAGVVEKECEGCGVEAKKAQAVIARSYALKLTNFGNNSIRQSTDHQDYKEPTEATKEIVKETEGKVLVYEGDILTSYYSSYPSGGLSGFPAFNSNGYTCQPINCTQKEDGRTWCDTTLYKTIDSNNLDSIETWTFSMPATDVNGNTWNGDSLNNQLGHCYGLSQVGATYMGNELNKKYDEILYTFYPSGVVIVNLNNLTTEGTYVIAGDYTFTTQNYNIENANGTPIADNPYYNGTLNRVNGIGSIGNISQCPWYAKSRAMEIIASSNLPEDRKQLALTTIRDKSGDGRTWYAGTDSNFAGLFAYSNDITKPQPGSIVAWNTKSHKHGHVGIIEQVNPDGTVVLSDGWNYSCKSDGKGSISCGLNDMSNVKIVTRTWTLSQLYNYNGSGQGHTFIGYTYLFSFVK